MLHTKTCSAVTPPEHTPSGHAGSRQQASHSCRRWEGAAARDVRHLGWSGPWCGGAGSGTI